MFRVKRKKWENMKENENVYSWVYTRVKEVTEIATEILLIFSVDFVQTFLFASISVLTIFKTAEEE